MSEYEYDRKTLSHTFSYAIFTVFRHVQITILGNVEFSVCRHSVFEDGHATSRRDVETGAERHAHLAAPHSGDDLRLVECGTSRTTALSAGRLSAAFASTHFGSALPDRIVPSARIASCSVTRLAFEIEFAASVR